MSSSQKNIVPSSVVMCLSHSCQFQQLFSFSQTLYDSECVDTNSDDFFLPNRIIAAYRIPVQAREKECVSHKFTAAPVSCSTTLSSRSALAEVSKSFTPAERLWLQGEEVLLGQEEVGTLGCVEALMVAVLVRVHVRNVALQALWR